ncbi:MAG: hypothetical protein WKF77_15990 [Planctomycetaceae bacterium]
MFEYLLIVREALSTEQFENCEVVSHRSHWPSMIELQRVSAQHSCPFVAFTGSADADSVQRMVKLLGDPAISARRIVFADDAVPGDLRAAFPELFSPLLRRVLPCDLVCLSATIVQEAAPTDTMLSIVFRGDVGSSAVAAWPSVNRFPQSGPGNGQGNSGLLADVLESAVDAALADVMLCSAERKCITSGVLLLWDFLHESHEISQTMEGRGTPRTADYWHAIMHRREPDAGNASYWFRRVGSHPAFDRLQVNIEAGWLKQAHPMKSEDWPNRHFSGTASLTRLP